MYSQSCIVALPVLALLSVYPDMLYCQDNKAELIKEFLLNKNLKTAVLFICESKPYQIKLFNELKKMFLLISIKEPTKVNMKVFKNTMRSRLTYSAVILEMKCKGSMDILKLASKYKMFSSNYYWLVFGKDQHNGRIEKVLFKNEIILSIESEVIWVKYSITNATLYDLYQTGIHPYGRICVTRLTTNLTHKWNHRKWKFDTRTNLQNLILNATAVIKPNTGISANSDRSVLQDEQEIIKYLTNDQEYYTDSMSKFSWAVFQLVQDQFNFTVKIVPTASWGYKWNGKFDGMVALLSNGSADIAATVAVIRNTRLDVVDFTTAQIWPYQPLFLLRHPHQIGSIRNIFFRPLSNEVWVCVFIILLLVFIIMRLSTWLLRHFRLLRGEDSWSGSIIMIIAATSQQGSSIVPRQLGYRLVFLLLFIWAMFIYQFYTSSIVSTLLFAPSRTIRTLPDLAHSNVRIGFEDVLTSKDALNRFRWNPYVRMLYEKHVKPNESKAFYSPEEGVTCLKKGMFAFYVDPASAYKKIEDTFSDSEICDLTEIHLGMKQFLSLPIQKHSPYKKLLTYGIRKIISSGLTKREVLRYLNRKPICALTSAGQSRPVGLVETFSALLILLVGLFLSILLLFTEIIYFKYKNMYSQTKNSLI